MDRIEDDEGTGFHLRVSISGDVPARILRGRVSAWYADDRDFKDIGVRWGCVYNPVGDGELGIKLNVGFE